ncbi:hypothetical protein HY933_03425 [Candidatus Falkowbacteria bacterium]|nr:hypothetical protein [Candidatus Falkowbacteria bacterium]
MIKKTVKAERREQKHRRTLAKTSATLAGQVLKLTTSRRYRGDVKKMK